MNVLNATVLFDQELGGGTAERTYQMARALAAKCSRVTVLTNDIGRDINRIQDNNKIDVVGLPVLVRRFPLPFFPLKLLRNLLLKADVIHLMGHWNMLNIFLYLLATRYKVPYVVCPAGELPIFGRSAFIKRVFNLLIGFRIVRRASGHVAITPDEFEDFKKYGIRSSRVTLIPNGINEDDFKRIPGGKRRFWEKYGIKKGPVLLFMGRLNVIKGPDLLLKAFYRIHKIFPDCQLIYAGPDGGMLESLKDDVKSYQLSDRVRFIGFVKGQEKTDAYRAADFLVIPSRQEAMSIVVLEAGINGVPVLITDQCGFEEVGRVKGGLVTPADPYHLAMGMERLLSDPEEGRKMGERLNRFVKEKYLWHRISDMYMDLFQSVSEGKRRAG